MKKALTVVVGCLMHLILLLIFVQKVQGQSKALRFNYFTIKGGLSLSKSCSIFQDNHGYIWIETQGGLNRVDGNQFKAFKDDPFDSTTLTHGWGCSIQKDRNGNIWMGSFHCLCKYIRRDDSFVQSYHQAHYSTSSSENMSNYILRDRKDKVNKFTNFKNDPDDQQSSSDNAVHTLLWIGTNNGPVFYEDQSKISHPYLHEPSNPSVPSSNSIYASMEDRTTSGWISGTDLI